ncbi:DUF6292 family protein [Lentzea sp. CA-135723]|uniref:DUF6292 family protein n=1 Tax=Lentzea sp. CA-135723 TaxID=3239950 RepID=UPI003D8FB4DE
MTIDFGFDIDFDDSAARQLRRYVREVVTGLGLRGDSSCFELTPLPGAYIALDGRLAEHPDHYVALVWKERAGWSVAIEDRLGELVEVAHLDGLHPSPASVVAWVKELLHGDKRSNRDFAAFLPAPRTALS